ncbi:MAG: aspartate/glutamate racemase family protein [Firmicutes bacterium]|nr:aspartate/glutamate racemase family protein [Bacillota bacterium]
MLIKIINPNTTQSMTKSIEKAAKKYAGKDTEIIAVNPVMGPDSIETYYDEYLSVPGVLEEIIKGDREERVDAFVIACFNDPGLYAARELTSKPVIGIAEAAITTAKFIAPCFSVVTVLNRSKHITKEIIRKYNAQDYCASVRATNLSVLDFDRCPEKGLEALAEESRKAVEQDGAECILLGCAGFVNFVEDLQKTLGVPVLDGVSPAVKFAEILVDMGCRTSKILTYGFPEKKQIIGFSDILKKLWD